MIEQLLAVHYGISLSDVVHADSGVGGETYFINSGSESYVLKQIEENEMNNAEAEAALCVYLRKHNIPACRFIPTKTGELTVREGNQTYHLQEFFPGTTYPLNGAPDSLLPAQAELLGDIHTALLDYPSLPIGIGESFFHHMTPEQAYSSYLQSRDIARKLNDGASEAELNYRLELVQRHTKQSFDLSDLTCVNTHGDYGINQLIVDPATISIAAVIDWTSACVHPAIWELIRSFVYASPCCAEGSVDTAGFILYASAYLSRFSLTRADVAAIGELFFRQLLVADYYHQYYASTALNRELFLHQARFSTALLRWFDEHMEEFTRELLASL